MTIRHLTIFSEVCRNESITRAADSLNMSQPAVSSAIRELEAYYQTKLFERMNRRLYITEAGRYLLHHADAILTQLAEAKSFLTDIDSATQIRIGSNVSFGQNRLAGLITDFTQKYPGIPVQITIQNSGDVEELLLRNQLDFAIADDLTDSACFHHQLLLSEDMAAACSPDCVYLQEIFSGSGAEHMHSDPLTPDDLARIPLLLREKGSGSRTIADNLFRSCAVHPTVVVESTDTQALIEFALRGHGLVLLPRVFLIPHFQTGRLVELPVGDGDTKRTLSRNYYLVYHRSKFLTQSMKLFLSHLTESDFK